MHFLVVRIDDILLRKYDFDVIYQVKDYLKTPFVTMDTCQPMYFMGS